MMEQTSLADASRRLRHVFLRDMVLPARVGVYPHEHAAPQRVRINVDLAVEEAPPIQTKRPLTIHEELTRVVDYEKVANQVRKIVAARHIRLVETLAEQIATACLADSRVLIARIRVEKLDVFPDAAAAGVEIERVR